MSYPLVVVAFPERRLIVIAGPTLCPPAASFHSNSDRNSSPSASHWDGQEINYINADYTLSLSRLPSGPYIGLAALTQSAHEGIATGTVVVFDAQGEIGTGVANALANPSWKAPSWAAPTDLPVQ